MKNTYVHTFKYIYIYKMRHLKWNDFLNVCCLFFFGLSLSYFC